MDVLSWFFGATTVIGVVLTIYYGRKAAQLEQAQKKLDWADIQACANDLGTEIRKSFSPDVIFTPGLRGATFANLLVEELHCEIPVFVGVSSWKSKQGALSTCDGFAVLETSKWYVHVPECLLAYKDKKLLIIDDFTMSGDFLDRVRKLLESHGFSAENIKSACIATTRVAVHSHKSPDYSWMQTADDSFYFPWGKAK